MKQFNTIFSFEYKSYAKNKMFVGLTVVLIIVMAVVLFYPRFSGGTDINSVGAFAESSPENVALLDLSGGNTELTAEYLRSGLAQSTLTVVSESEDELKSDVVNGEYDLAIVLTSPLSYRYIVETASLTDTTSYVVDEVLKTKYQYEKLSQLGISDEETTDIMSSAVTNEAVITGKDQNQSFFYTYILMFLLYFAVMVYGQFVAQSVAVEKSSRAMELLITSAKPVNLMFGKILGAGAAGFTQLVLLLGSAFGFYAANKTYWEDNYIIKSVFGMPVSMLLYTILFFVLGFMIYSFMYGALASLASRLEDVNTLIMPVTFMMVIAFMITIFSMINNVDSPLMKAASFIPFTSPMAMFTRIAMGNVSNTEIIISVAVLVVTTVLIGYLAAAIYKIGVLMYGKPPKMNELVRALKTNKK